MKKLIFLLPVFISVNAGAEEITEPFPSSTRGIQYVSESQMNLPPGFNNETKKFRQEMKDNGYVYTISKGANELLNQKRDSIAQLRESDKIQNPYDTHLRRNLSDIKLSFTYPSLPSVASKDVIGYAASGSYTKEPGKPEGWNGIATLFEHREMGSCVFHYDHIIAAQIDKKKMHFKVNGKPGSTIIEGTPKTGFFYDIIWYTDKTDKSSMTESSLECANRKFDRKIIDRMMEFAKTVDKNLKG